MHLALHFINLPLAKAPSAKVSVLADVPLGFCVCSLSFVFCDIMGPSLLVSLLCRWGHWLTYTRSPFGLWTLVQAFMNVSHTASWCPWLLGFSHWLQPTGDSGLQGSHHHISSSPHQLSLWRSSHSTIYHTFSCGGCSSGDWAGHLLSGRLVVHSLALQSACQISQNYS